MITSLKLIAMKHAILFFLLFVTSVGYGQADTSLLHLPKVDSVLYDFQTGAVTQRYFYIQGGSKLSFDLEYTNVVVVYEDLNNNLRAIEVNEAECTTYDDEVTWICDIPELEGKVNKYYFVAFQYGDQRKILINNF